MDRRSRLAEAVRALDPDRQGQLDSLCGLYAIINAYRLAVYPSHQLSRTQRRQLFDAGIGFLGSRRWLRRTIGEGMTLDTFKVLATHVVQAGNAMTGARVAVIFAKGRDPPERQLQAIRRSVRRGMPVILWLEGRINHWTVVGRFSASRLMLFDSDGRSYIAVRSISDIPGGYRISASAIVGAPP